MKSFLLCHKTFRATLIVAVSCALVLTSAIQPRTGWALSIGEEKELGRKILEQIKNRMPLVEDGDILTYVRTVGNRIVKQLGPTSYQHQFFVVNESVPNAFAIPGGYIFINRGLMELLKSEGELAGILSHELAHIQARHIHRRLEEGKIWNIATLAGLVAGILLGATGSSPQAGQALAMGSMAGAATVQLKFSRENEEEADQLGLRYLVGAGYAAGEMMAGMQRLKDASFPENSRVSSYLSTHPALGERISYLRDLSQKQPGTPVKMTRQKDVGDFALMEASLVAEYTDVQVALNRLQNGVNRDEPAAIYGLGRLYMRQGNVAEAMPYLQKAVQANPASSLVISTLGDAYFRQGRISEAQKAFQTGLLLDPYAPIVHLRLATLLQESGQRDAALEHLEKIADLTPTFPEIDYQLGVVLGQLNRLGPAHYHLGRYYIYKRDWKLAVFHYTKARPFYLGSSARLEEIDRVLKEAEKKKKDSVWERPRR